MLSGRIETPLLEIVQRMKASQSSVLLINWNFKTTMPVDTRALSKKETVNRAV